MRGKRGIAALAAAAAWLAAPLQVDAFCGFYVGGAGSPLYNRATNVVLMREGTRTVLSMQNNYQGPPENFAMVVPVPVVLQQEQVRTLPRDLFARVDALSAPKLVEYWEQDPCPQPIPQDARERAYGTLGADVLAAPAMMEQRQQRDLGVRVEAQFAVGEYDIVILSARDSSGLETWLRQERYNIPQGAHTALAPYVQAGTKFFVARVNVERVTFENGQVMLSPLRFHYDSSEFSLPVRLGLMNSSGTQDLIVHILARGARYDVANYRNVLIPTNINVADRARSQFGAFYAALFDAMIAENPGAVVTEYAWEGAIPEFAQSASTCDPCPPTPPRPAEDLLTLGLDVLPSYRPDFVPGVHGSGIGRPYVLTRLHYRYGPGDLRDDLVFREASPIVGGREQHYGGYTQLGMRSRGERTVSQDPGTTSQFQARYAIRHWWPHPITCESPVRGVWGGPPDGRQPAPPESATNAAFAPRRGVQLQNIVRSPIRELGIRPPPRRARPNAQQKTVEPKSDLAAQTAIGITFAALGIAPLLIAGFASRRRRD